MNPLAIFDAAYAKRDNDGTPATEQDCRRAGIAAVIRAVRDEIAAIEGWSGAKGRMDEVFNRILGDAGEKVAGGSTRKDGQHNGETVTPATDLYFEHIRNHYGPPSAELCEDCPRIGHSTDETRCTTCPRRKPADPAPAVCEYRNAFEAHENRNWRRRGCNGEVVYREAPGHCLYCGKPIAFTEAK